MEAEPRWGILYFSYDWFSAIRTDMAREVKYDTFITVYMSDCDFYPRVRAAGWKTLEYRDYCPGISPRVSSLASTTSWRVQQGSLPGLAVWKRTRDPTWGEACRACVPWLFPAKTDGAPLLRKRASLLCSACEARPSRAFSVAALSQRGLSQRTAQAYDMKRAMELPGEHEAMRAALEAEEARDDVDRNAWKRAEWRDGEDVGAFGSRGTDVGLSVIGG